MIHHNMKMIGYRSKENIMNSNENKPVPAKQEPLLTILGNAIGNVCDDSCKLLASLEAKERYLFRVGQESCSDTENTVEPVYSETILTRIDLIEANLEKIDFIIKRII